jgi:hypothetical protein
VAGVSVLEDACLLARLDLPHEYTRCPKTTTLLLYYNAFGFSGPISLQIKARQGVYFCHIAKLKGALVSCDPAMSESLGH